MISGNVTSGKPVERQRARHYKHKAPLLQRCFSRGGCSLLYLLEAKCQAVSELPELAERKSSQCQMLKSPGLQGAFSNHLQERIRKAPATGCGAERGPIPASVCQPAANGRRRTKTYLGNPPPPISSVTRAQDHFSCTALRFAPKYFTRLERLSGGFRRIGFVLRDRESWKGRNRTPNSLPWGLSCSARNKELAYGSCCEQGSLSPAHST